MSFSKSCKVWKDHIKKELEKLKEKNLYRKISLYENPNRAVFSHKGKRIVNLSSNNYLGLASSEKVCGLLKEGVSLYGAGSGASRLICGSFEVHEEAERIISDFKEKEASLLFGSGYMANISILTALGDENTEIFSDELNHASIIDGCRLSRAEVKVYRHRDVNHLEDLIKHSKKRRLIITDGVFSMDGDLAPLKDLVDVAERYSALLVVDDAHGTGVMGRDGRGSTFLKGVSKDIPIIMGTLGKALGLFGAFVSCSQDIRNYLVNKARPFIYTTAIPPAIAYAVKGTIPMVMNMEKERDELHKKARFLKEGIRDAGFDTLDSETQIIPMVVGDEERTMELSRHLLEEGFLAHGIRPPTVPKGTSRIRISVTSEHSWEDLERFISVLRKWNRKNHHR